MKEKNETLEDEDGLKVEKISRRYDFDALVEDYVSESEKRETTPKMTLYKYDIEKSNGGGDKELTGYFLGDEIPNKHQVGLMFGGGRYQAYLYQPRGTAGEKENVGITFRIGHVYDDLKKQRDEQKRQEELKKYGLPTPAAPAGTSTAESFIMLKEILSTIMPAIKAQANATPAPAAPDMMTQYAMMQNLLKKNLFDTAETYRAFSRRFNIGMEQAQEGEDIEPQLDAEQKEPGIMAYVERIIKMIEPFFGLLAQKGPAAQVTAETVRAAPQFAEMLNDPQLCRLIIQYFDRTKGVDVSNQALKNLGINRASLFAATPGAGGRTAAQSAAAATPAMPRKPNLRVLPGKAAKTPK